MKKENMEKVNYFGLYFGIAKYIFGDDLSTIEIVNRSLFVNIPFINNPKTKLILRLVEDMTEDEKREYDKLQNYNLQAIKEQINNWKNTNILERDKDNNRHIIYLISIGVDVFNLIEKGWAVRESETKK